MGASRGPSSSWCWGHGCAEPRSSAAGGSVGPGCSSAPSALDTPQEMHYTAPRAECVLPRGSMRGATDGVSVQGTCWQFLAIYTEGENRDLWCDCSARKACVFWSSLTLLSAPGARLLSLNYELSDSQNHLGWKIPLR